MTKREPNNIQNVGGKCPPPIPSINIPYFGVSLVDVGCCDIGLFCGCLDDLLDSRGLCIELTPSAWLSRVGLSTSVSEEGYSVFWAK